MSALPSMSKIGRVLACPASHALPQEELPVSEHADDGTARHEALANLVLNKPNEDALNGWLEGLVESGVVEVLRKYRPEVALVYDAAFGTARELGQFIARAYGELSPTEVPGSADYLQVDGEVVRVIDLKTGRVEVKAQGNEQLLTLAVAACRLYGAKRAEVAILWAPEGSTPRWDWNYLALEQLEQHASELAQALLQRVSEARSDIAAGLVPRHVEAGSHCRFCPAQASCPTRSMVMKAAAEPTFRSGWQQALTAGQTAQVWQVLQTLRSEADAIEAALRTMAKVAPLDIGEGRTVGWRTVERETIDAEQAWPALVALLGEDGARAAVAMETSKAAIERGVKAAKAAGKVSGPIKAGVEQVLKAVRESGAVTTKSTERFEELKR